MYIVTTSKITGPNFYLSWSLSTIMLRVLLLVFSPFFAKRYHPNITVHPKCDIASSQACDFTINLDEL